MRILTDVGPNGSFASRTPWGRGLPIDGDGKVNLSSKGREVAIIVVNTPQPVDCLSQTVRRLKRFH